MMTQMLANDSQTTSLIDGISWDSFEAIKAAFTEVADVRLAYLDGALEIMPISNEHEELKSTLGRLEENFLIYLR
jgi:Uma2 family endonuclease